MKGKVCIVTGANSGIGKVTALELAKKGATVVLVCRNRDRGEAAKKEIISLSKNEKIDLLIADLGLQSEIRKLAEEFKSKYDRLDVLVNNAGLIIGERTLTAEGIESTFAINHLGYFLLTDLLLDLLKKSAPSRIVNVASEAHRALGAEKEDYQSEKNYSSFTTYGRSKLYNIMFTYELARRIVGTGVTANSLHPGTIATNFGDSGSKIFSILIKFFRPFLKTPEQGARTTIYLASDPEVEKISGKYFVDCRIAKPRAAALDEDAQQRLWEVSEKLTK